MNEYLNMQVRHQQPLRRRSNRRGTALMEFAVLSPLFLTLALGMIEMGSGMRASGILDAALREGGRLASMDWIAVLEEGQTPNDKVVADIKNFITAAGLPGDEVAVNIVHAEGPNEGTYFDLADPDNKLTLFRMEAIVPYSAISQLSLEYMGGQSLVAGLVMRAGRASMSN